MRRTLFGAILFISAAGASGSASANELDGLASNAISVEKVTGTPVPARPATGLVNVASPNRTSRGTGS
jgi:hypothetical protein